MIFPIIGRGDKSRTHAVCPGHLKSVRQSWARSKGQRTETQGFRPEIVNNVTDAGKYIYKLFRLPENLECLTPAMLTSRREHS